VIEAVQGELFGEIMLRRLAPPSNGRAELPEPVRLPTERSAG
jgi:hypothetical protein